MSNRKGEEREGQGAGEGLELAWVGVKVRWRNDYGGQPVRIGPRYGDAYESLFFTDFARSMHDLAVSRIVIIISLSMLPQGA